MATTPKKRKRGLPVKPEALRLMEEKMREKGFIFTTQEEMYAELAEKAGLTSSDTIKNVFNPQYGRKPERNTVQLIASALGLYPWEIVEGWNPPESSDRAKPKSSEVSVFNRQIFQEMLDKQRSLTANPLINANFEASKLYVPLGLVESKKQERRKDVNPEMGSRLYRSEEYEITRQFENDEFLVEVLLRGNSPKSQGKRIAIIGEPGSGKTTRLQQVADRLFNDNNENLVIWVSLADLQDKNLEDFLLNTWLKIALKQKEASEESQDKLIEKFNEGNVWLLLDGLDEMRLDHNPLHWVNSQIKGWIESAKVILTCRVNIWESGNNYLSNFDVYRNLDFSEPQRNEFIYKFFTDRNLADQLITALNQDGKERIRDLVKNPLRLTLVCYSWEKNQGSLPETKAGLYQECVEAFYLWKEVEFQTTIAQRKLLNQALGELAKQALEQESSKFRLTKSFICDVLDKLDEELFSLALDLGWLNRVGVAEENPNEQVYAFFHPTFQEYFAACAIENWNFFLPCDHVDKPVEGKVYRIFESQWKQVFLLWLGRADIDKSDKEIFIWALVGFNHLLGRVDIDILDKETLIKFKEYCIRGLVVFNHPLVDQCDRFYHCQAFYIAAEGIAEFKDCSFADMIIDVIIQWGCYPQAGKTRFEDTPIAELAREILLKTDTQKAITALIKLIQSSQDESLIENLTSTLEEIAPKNKQVITALIELVQDPKNESIIYTIVESLGRIGHKNSLVITALIELIKSCKNFDFDTIEEVVYELGQIGKGNDYAITALIEFLQCSEDEFVIYVIVDSLGEIVQDSSQAERVINSLRESLKDELIFKNALDSFLERYCKAIIEEPLPIAITSLNQLLQSSKNFDFDAIDQLAYNFHKMGKRNNRTSTESKKNIESSLKSSKDVVIGKGLLDAVEEIQQGINQAKKEINSLRESLKNELIFENVLNSFLYSYCNKIQEEALRKVLKLKSVRYLKENNEKEIISLIEIIQFSQNKADITNAVISLGEMEQGNEQAVTALVSFIQYSHYGGALSWAKRSLSKIMVKDQMPRVVTDLKGGLSKKTYTNYNDYYRYGDYYRFTTCFSVLWQCAQTLSYPEFYKAWHSQPEIIHPEILEISPLGNTEIAQTLNQQILDLPSQLKPTDKTYPLVINAQSIEDETDNSSIAQEICNQIYAKVFPDETNIPEINNAPQLKRLIPNLKKQLNTQNLALIFHKGEPNESLNIFCKQLATDTHIYVRWITKQKMEYINSIPPQENLVNILQNWINELD